jgi:hypothetical protein
MGSHAMIHTKFHKDWFRYSKVNVGGGYRDNDTTWRHQNHKYFFYVRKTGYEKHKGVRKEERERGEECIKLGERQKEEVKLEKEEKL